MIYKTHYAKGSLHMKKYLVYILCLVLIVSIAATASASTISVSKTLTSTSTYVNALVKPSHTMKATGSSSWNAPFSGASDSQRVVARVYQYRSSGIVVSSTWVYTGYSTTSHPYKSGYGKGHSYEVFLGAKVDDRDVGPITISGTFNSDYN